MTILIVQEAKQQLDDLVDRCLCGEEVFIETDDRRTVKLTAVPKHSRFAGEISLPFFAYGVFKPGQLAFQGLRDSVRSIEENAEVKGCLLIRDGMPILDEGGAGHTKGSLITFLPERAEEAYGKIAGLEPDDHYRWGVSDVCGRNVNVLFGVSPRKGSVPMEEAEWDGANDPLFTSALNVIQETLDGNAEFEWDLRPLLRLQMAYLLLWSSMERYATLRYCFSGSPMKNILKIGSEPAFRQALAESKLSRRVVFRADDPAKKRTLNGDDPEAALQYYYQVRSNITHRGKAVFRDHELIRSSLSELLEIFRKTLIAAFGEA